MAHRSITTNGPEQQSRNQNITTNNTNSDTNGHE